MDKALIKLFEKHMFGKSGNEDGFKKFVLDYYEDHPEDTFEYPQERYELLSKGDPQEQWTMEDIIVYYLYNSKLSDRISLV